MPDTLPLLKTKCGSCGIKIKMQIQLAFPEQMEEKEKKTWYCRKCKRAGKNITEQEKREDEEIAEKKRKGKGPLFEELEKRKLFDEKVLNEAREKQKQVRERNEKAIAKIKESQEKREKEAAEKKRKEEEEEKAKKEKTDGK